MIERFTVSTRGRTDFHDITDQVRRIAASSGITEGLCHVSISHTTAGITINENADPAVRTDMMNALDKLVPWNAGYKHFEGNSAAHIKSSLMGFSVMLPIENGGLVLGTWQDIYLCEFDGPRTRTVVTTVIGNE